MLVLWQVRLVFKIAMIFLAEEFLLRAQLLDLLWGHEGQVERQSDEVGLEGVVVFSVVSVLDDRGTILLHGADVLKLLDVGGVAQNAVSVDANKVLSAHLRLLQLLKSVFWQNSTCRLGSPCSSYPP